MKSMKLYTNVQRIHNELAALGIGPDAALRVARLFRNGAITGLQITAR